MINAFFTDMMIGGGIIVAIMVILWIAGLLWQYRNVSPELPSFENPLPPEPEDISSPSKNNGMVIINKDKKGEYYLKTVAGNWERLNHTEGLSTKRIVRNHLIAYAKATNSNGLTINDKTGDFPDLHNYQPKKRK